MQRIAGQVKDCCLKIIHFKSQTKFFPSFIISVNHLAVISNLVASTNEELFLVFFAQNRYAFRQRRVGM
jgi:hypothetical protein